MNGLSNNLPVNRSNIRLNVDGSASFADTVAARAPWSNCGNATGIIERVWYGGETETGTIKADGSADV